MWSICRMQVGIPRTERPVVRCKPEGIKCRNQWDQRDNARNDCIYFNSGMLTLLLFHNEGSTDTLQTVFSVHDGAYFTRDLGGIDLSEVYHDVIAVLRMKTEWVTKTLSFWNQ